MNPLFLWFILRLFTSFFAGIVSSIKPMLPIENTIPIFPPSIPISEWLSRVFLSPWMRWDAVWYERIVTQGYSATDGTAPFHPLYPWLAKPLASIGISSELSLLLISSLSGIALFYFFIKLANYDLPPGDASFALMLFAFAPPAFILFAPYAEALFLLAAVLCMIFIRQKSWWLAGLMGGLATLTRQQGLFLLIPLAWELWENSERKLNNLVKQWRDWLALGLIPLGMLVWLAYRAVILNDLQVNSGSFQEFVYSMIISPSAASVVPDQQFVWPWLAIKYAISKLFTQPDMDIWVNILVAVIFLSFMIIAWKRIRLSYRLYSLAIALVSFSYYTGPVHPYMGLPRHLFLAFPIFIGVATVVKKRWLRLFIFGLSGLVMLFLLSLYIFNAWVP